MLGLLATLVTGTPPALAARVTHWVNDDDPNGGAYASPGTSCANPGYPTIQSAVDAARRGDTINVCPGMYREQVAVETPAKSNLVVRSVVPLAARIQAPAVMETVHGDLVRIDAGARDVTLSGFVIAGPLPDTLFCALQLRSGVRVKGNSSASIRFNRITEMRSANPVFQGCQNGFGIAVGRAFDVPVPGQVGQATIVGNVVDQYQKGGIYVDNVGSRVTIEANLVAGDGPSDVIAQIGIQINRGASALLRGNAVRDHAYFPPVLPCVPFATCVAATGILVFDTDAKIVVHRNDLHRNQDGIAVFTAYGNAFSKNRIIGDIPASSVPGAPFGTGIFAAADTADNQIVGNFVRNHIEHDCEDDSVGRYRPAMVANIWRDNDGLMQNRPGLCRPRHGGDDHGDDDDHGDNDDHRDGHGHDD
jgi:nitrous oxidase accessory protein NosD